MQIVVTVGRIRREHLVQGKSIKEIARNLKLSRNTVRRVLRSGKTVFVYEQEVQPRPRLARQSRSGRVRDLAVTIGSISRVQPTELA